MLRGWPSLILGFAGLALLEGIVSSRRASSNVGGFLAKAGDAVRWFTSPAVPFFAAGARQTSATAPNHPNPSTSASTSTQSVGALSYGAGS